MLFANQQRIVSSKNKIARRPEKTPGMAAARSKTTRSIGPSRCFGRRSLFNLTSAALSLFMLLLNNFGPRLQAQNNYGSVVGTVTDSTGAIVSGAHVTLTNKGTSATQSTTSGSGGTFSFVNLIPGLYDVTVSQKGFKSATQNAVDVQIGGATRADIALPVGEVSESVTVSAATSDLHTDSSTLTGVIEGRQVEESPLNGRNVNNL